MFQSRFKAYLIPHNDLAGEAQALRSHFSQVFCEHQRGTYNAAECLFRIILCYLEKRRPQKWWMKKSSLTVNEVWNLNAIAKNLNPNWLTEFSHHYRIKLLPEALLNTLVHYRKNPDRLLWLDQVPSPTELLLLQCQGKRVLTFNFDLACAGSLVDGKRDSLEFLLHDLVHASLFFGDQHQEQVSFFRAYAAWKEQWHKEYHQDEIFMNEMNYVMADMNSHTQHMLFSVKASLIDYEKRKEKKSSNEDLSSAAEARWLKQVEWLNQELERRRIENGSSDPIATAHSMIGRS